MTSAIKPLKIPHGLGTFMVFIAMSMSIGLSTSKAHAESPFSDGWMPENAQAYSPYYNGMFTSFGARMGLHQVGGNDYEGWGVEIGPRMSFPMLVGDMRVRYRYDALTNGNATKDMGDINVHSIGFGASVHPLYLLLLGSDWISYVAASLSLDIGLGAQYATRARNNDSLARVDFGFFWHWGAGLDIPLWDPDVGNALWLNVVYRNHRSDFDLGDDRELSLSMHTIFLGLEWRFNRLLF